MALVCIGLQTYLLIFGNFCSLDEEDDRDLDGSDSEEMSDSSLAEEPESQETIPVSISSDVSNAVSFTSTYI